MVDAGRGSNKPPYVMNAQQPKRKTAKTVCRSSPSTSGNLASDWVCVLADFVCAVRHTGRLIARTAGDRLRPTPGSIHEYLAKRRFGWVDSHIQGGRGEHVTWQGHADRILGGDCRGPAFLLAPILGQASSVGCPCVNPELVERHTMLPGLWCWRSTWRPTVRCVVGRCWWPITGSSDPSQFKSPWNETSPRVSSLRMCGNESRTRPTRG